MSSRRSRKTFDAGKTIGRYSIMKLVGQGGYGDIYECLDLDNHQFYAIKVESLECKKQGLKRELDIIRHLHSKYFPEFVCYGETSKYRYLVMELLGPSFSGLRRILPNHKFSMSTVLRVGIEMLKCIQKLHSLGFLHRDIKPSNFLIRASRRHPLALTDFGLSRQFIDPRTKTVSRPRQKPGFVGTTKYASLNAHAGKELGCVDDLYSWFFSLMEMWAGRLPWSVSADKDEVFNAKLQTDIQEFIRDMPKQMTNIYRLIRRMKREDKPNYELIYAFLLDAMKDIGASWDDPYEWEHIDTRELSPISLIPPAGEKPQIPQNLPEPVMPRLDINNLPIDDLPVTRTRRTRPSTTSTSRRYDYR